MPSISSPENRWQQSILQHCRQLIGLQTVLPTTSLGKARAKACLQAHHDTAQYLQRALQQAGLSAFIHYTPDMFSGNQKYMQRWQAFCAKEGVIDGSRLPHVAARTHPENNGGPVLLLTGHYDVVDDAPSGFTLQENGDKLIGRGTSDMKGNLAALLTALEMRLQTLPIMVVINSLEENAAPFGMNDHLEYLINQGWLTAQNQVYALDLESNDLRVLTARRGAYDYGIAIPTEAFRHNSDGLACFEYTGIDGHAGSFSLQVYQKGETIHSLYAAAKDYFEHKQSNGWYPAFLETGRKQAEGNILPVAENVIPPNTCLWLSKDQTKLNLWLEATLRLMYELSENSTIKEPDYNHRGSAITSFYVNNGRPAVHTKIRSAISASAEIKKIFDAAIDRTNQYLREKGRDFTLPYGEFEISFPLFHQAQTPFIQNASQILKEIAKNNPDPFITEAGEFMLGMGCSDLQHLAAILAQHGIPYEAFGVGGVEQRNHRPGEWTTQTSLDNLALFLYNLMQYQA